MAIQFLWVLFSGNKNKPLLSFASQLATFIYQIYRYLSFNTEKRPFPFDDFPSDEALLNDAVAEPEETPAPAETATEVEVVAEEAPADSEKEEAAKKAPAKRRKPAAKNKDAAPPAESAPDAADEGENH